MKNTTAMPMMRNERGADGDEPRRLGAGTVQARVGRDGQATKQHRDDEHDWRDGPQ